jgi:mevalonate kinase
MKTGYGRTHGKIILIGEHAVVYGTRAIAIPFFNTTCEVSVYQSDDIEINSILYSGKLENAPLSMESVISLINELTKNLKLPNLMYNIDSNIPISSGMGSSAAVASGIVAAVYDYSNIEMSSATRFHWIQFSERIAHGNPSGIDALTTTNDNGWLFQKGFEPIKFDAKLNGFLIVGQTGKIGNTKEAVSAVKRIIEEENKMYLIEEISKEVDIAYFAYINQDIKSVSDAMNNAQNILRILNVSSKEIDEMVDDAMLHGALAAKLTGGGRGGTVIALTEKKEIAETIKNAWENYSDLKGWILDLNEV